MARAAAAPKTWGRRAIAERTVRPACHVPRPATISRGRDRRVVDHGPRSTPSRSTAVTSPSTSRDPGAAIDAVLRSLGDELDGSVHLPGDP